jgi:hypothetical protein
MLGVRLGFPNKERSRACLDPIAFLDSIWWFSALCIHGLATYGFLTGC